jgi:MFS family permease
MIGLQNVFGLGDFRRLFAGVTTSHLGDQFALIATPWLVMQMTGDPLMLGIVLALEGGPRALFMLIGGAVTDRFSPRMVMIVCDLARLILAALMAVAVLTGAITLWMVFAFAVGFGLIAGFAVPAGNSIVPMVVGQDDLEAGNAMVMGGSQLMGFFGPVGAGVLIGYFTTSLTGVGLAFAIDALTFAVSAWMLWRMKRGGELAAAGADIEPIGDAVWRGLAYVWQNDAMRLMFLIIAAVNFLFVGPIMVGIPVLAEQRLPEGPVAFGLLMSGFAGGNLFGYLAAAALPQLGNRKLRLVLITLLGGFAIVLGVMGTVPSTWALFGLLAGLGVANGYVTIVLMSAIQKRAPKDMLGRVMGLFMFAGLGLVPISEAISGAISRFDVTFLFLGAATLTALMTIWTASRPTLALISFDIAQSTTKRAALPFIKSKPTSPDGASNA